MNWFPDETAIKQLTTNQVLFDHHETWNLSYLHYLFQHFHPRRSSSESSERAEIIILQSFSLNTQYLYYEPENHTISIERFLNYLPDRRRKKSGNKWNFHGNKWFRNPSRFVCSYQQQNHCEQRITKMWRTAFWFWLLSLDIRF